MKIKFKNNFILIQLENSFFRHSTLDVESPNIADKLWRLRVKSAMMGLLFFTVIVFTVLFATQTVNAQFEISQSLGDRKIVKLYKNNPESPNVLAGVANIRFKSVIESDSVAISFKLPEIATLFARNDGLVPKQDFVIFESYLTEKNAVSSQKIRFENYPKEQQNKILELEEKLFRTFIIQFDENICVLEFCKNIVLKYPEIEIAEPYYIAEFQGVPNDPYAPNQTVLHTIQAFQAWELSEGDETVAIGVSDSGVNWQHEDLWIDALALNTNESNILDGTDADGNGYIDDFFGYNFAWRESGGEEFHGIITNSSNSHGTDVAGIIGARTNNSKGIAGVGNKCKIIPMKVGTGSSAIYGYQSMIYAAVRGCKVLNCSWGSSSAFSFLNQSIVDYAVACDVAIVAAGGNNQFPIYSTVFPAGYFGVLGVGETRNNDVHNQGVIGPATRTMAQGIGNYTVRDGSQYPTLGNGSSFSAPVVSGIVGVLRSYKPELTALEALEIVRLSGENIRPKNNENGFIPVRANMLNALQLDDSKLPSIILKEKYFENTNSEKQERFVAGDTAILVLNLINILADAKNISLKLRELSVWNKDAFEFLDSEYFISEINKNAEYPLKLRLLVNNPSAILNTYYLVEMESEIENEIFYVDDFKFNLFISDNLTTLQNEKLVVSVSDKGTLGYDLALTNVQQGFGFSHLQFGNFLSESGVVAIGEALSTNPKLVSTRNSFETVQGFDGGENTTIITDSRANHTNKIGINISQKYEFPSDTSSVLRITLRAKNISGDRIRNFSFGHLYDWDITTASRNTVGYFPEAIPANLGKDFAAAEFATDEFESVFVGSLVFLNTEKFPDAWVEPQAAGVVAAAGSSILIHNRDLQIKSLTRGISEQTNSLADIGYFIGMHFVDDFLANSEVECVICTGVERTKELLAKSLLDCYEKTVSIIEVSTIENNSFTVKRNENILEIEIFEEQFLDSEIEIYSLLGVKIFSVKVADFTTVIDFSKQISGVYFIRLVPNFRSKNSLHYRSFIW